MTIDSKPALVSAPKDVIIHFLEDTRNLIHLLPQDNISDFQADISSCSFKAQGGIFTIALHQNGKEGNEKLFLKSGEGSPFPFDLTINLKDVSEFQTEGHIHFSGEVNMFMKMMVERPLTSLFNYMSKQLQEYFQR